MEASRRTHRIIKNICNTFVAIHIGINPAARTIIDARIILKLILKKTYSVKRLNSYVFRLYQ